MSIAIMPRLNIGPNNPSQVTTPAGFTGNPRAVLYFPGGPGSSAGVPAGLNSLSNGYISPGPTANGQIIAAKAAGDFTIGIPGSGIASPAVTLGLYIATFAGNNVGGAVTISATPLVSQILMAAADLGGFYPWGLSVDLMGTTNSGLVQAMSGYITIDGVAGTFAASVPLSNVNMSSPIPFALLVGITFSVADLAAQANMYEFSLNL